MTSNSPQSPNAEARDVPAREQAAAESMSFGAQLRAARLAKGLSIQDCVQTLHLPAQRLRQLEEDVRSEQGGDQVYLRGYITKYGRLVGLSEEVLARELETLKTPAPTLVASGVIPPAKYRLERYARAATYLVLTAVIVVPVAWLGLRGTFEHNISHLDPLDAQPVAQQDTVAPPTSLAAQKPALPAAASSSAPSLVAEAASAAPQPLASAAGAAVAPASETADATAQAASSPAAQPPLMAAMIPQPAESHAQSAGDVLGSGEHSLALSLSQESWVAVSTFEGTRLVYSMLPAGSHKVFRNDQGLKVRIGNANAAQVTLDGQAVPLDGYQHGNVAYFKFEVRDGKAEAHAF